MLFDAVPSCLVTLDKDFISRQILDSSIPYGWDNRVAGSLSSPIVSSFSLKNHLNHSIALCWASCKDVKSILRYGICASTIHSLTVHVISQSV